MKCKGIKCNGFGACSLILCNAEKHCERWQNKITDYFSLVFNNTFFYYSKSVIELSMFDIIKINYEEGNK